MSPSIYQLLLTLSNPFLFSFSFKILGCIPIIYLHLWLVILWTLSELWISQALPNFYLFLYLMHLFTHSIFTFSLRFLSIPFFLVFLGPLIYVGLRWTSPCTLQDLNDFHLVLKWHLVMRSYDQLIFYLIFKVGLLYIC